MMEVVIMSSIGVKESNASNDSLQMNPLTLLQLLEADKDGQECGLGYFGEGANAFCLYLNLFITPLSLLATIPT